MNPAPTFDRAYPIIKRRVLRGEWSSLEHIDVGLLADDLAISTIPVREILQRLVGERIVNLEPAGGFVMPALSETDLRDLYQWHAQLLRLATRQAEATIEMLPVGPTTDGDPEAFALITETIFSAIVRSAGNIEHVRAMLSAGERLRRVRMHEVRLIPHTAAELNAVISLTEGGRHTDLVEAISAYHRRRLRRVAPLAVNFSPRH